MNKINLKTNKKAVRTAGLAILLALAGTFAYFSDRATFNQTVEGAKFSIQVDRTSDAYDVDAVLMPGEVASAVNYTVTNTGTIDGDLREKLIAFAINKDGDVLPIKLDNPELGLYNTPDATIKYATETVKGEYVLYEVADYELTAGDIKEGNSYLKLHSSAENAYADADLYVGVLVEGKQKGSEDWVTLATETFDITGGKAQFADASEFVNIVAGKELSNGGNEDGAVGTIAGSGSINVTGIPAEVDAYTITFGNEKDVLMFFGYALNDESNKYEDFDPIVMSNDTIMNAKVQFEGSGKYAGGYEVSNVELGDGVLGASGEEFVNQTLTLDFNYDEGTDTATVILGIAQQ